MDGGDRQQRADEVEALRAIFGDDVTVEDEHLLAADAEDEPGRSVRVRLLIPVNAEGVDAKAELCLSLPAAYPGTDRPEVSLLCQGLTTGASRAVAEQLAAVAAEREGEVCAYDLCDALPELVAAALSAVRTDAPSRSVAAESRGGIDDKALTVVYVPHLHQPAAYCEKARGVLAAGALEGAIFFRSSESAIGSWEHVFVVQVAETEDELHELTDALLAVPPPEKSAASKGAKAKERRPDVLASGAVPRPDGGWAWARRASGGGPLPELDCKEDADLRSMLATFLRELGVEMDLEALDDGLLDGGVSPFRDIRKGCYLEVATRPNAKVTQITNLSDIRHGQADCIRIDMERATKRGEENKEMVNFLAEALGVRRDVVALVAGRTSREKGVTVEGLSADEAVQRLNVGGDA